MFLRTLERPICDFGTCLLVMAIDSFCGDACVIVFNVTALRFALAVATACRLLFSWVSVRDGCRALPTVNVCICFGSHLPLSSD